MNPLSSVISMSEALPPTPQTEISHCHVYPRPVNKYLETVDDVRETGVVQLKVVWDDAH